MGDLIQQIAENFGATGPSNGSWLQSIYENTIGGGATGPAGATGSNGTSGTSGDSGTSGSSGLTGTSGTSGVSGTSGSSGLAGTSGTSGGGGGGVTALPLVNNATYGPGFGGDRLQSGGDAMPGRTVWGYPYKLPAGVFDGIQIQIQSGGTSSGRKAYFGIFEFNFSVPPVQCAEGAIGPGHWIPRPTTRVASIEITNPGSGIYSVTTAAPFTLENKWYFIGYMYDNGINSNAEQFRLSSAQRFSDTFNDTATLIRYYSEVEELRIPNNDYGYSDPAGSHKWGIQVGNNVVPLAGFRYLVSGGFPETINKQPEIGRPTGAYNGGLGVPGFNLIAYNP